MEISEPALLFFPQGRAHRFNAGKDGGADLVCATIDLGGAHGSLLTHGLPPLIRLKLADYPQLNPACGLLIAEGFSDNDGRQIALDHLFDYLLILIIRHCVSSGMATSGVLAGLADEKLAKALTAMHEAPQQSFTLDTLASLANMSRTRFAAHFHTIVGRTPIDYLTSLRISVAQSLLASGKPVKTVARQSGYASSAAFARTFSKATGVAPKDWVDKFKT